MFKTCSRCKVEQPVENFSKGGPARSPDGLQYWCRSCVREHNKQYRETRREEIAARKKKHYEENKESILSNKRDKIKNESPEERQTRLRSLEKYRNTYPEKVAAAKRLWEEENKEENKQKKRVYYQNNKESFASKSRVYRQAHREETNKREKERRETDPQYLLTISLRTRLNRAIKEGYKAGSAVRDLGCSIEELKGYLESKFQSGMTWDNYGMGPNKWHIDHVMPLSAFDLTNRQHVVMACHYLNLQPLWQQDNLSKGSKIILPENRLGGCPVLSSGPSGPFAETSLLAASPVSGQHPSSEENSPVCRPF